MKKRLAGRFIWLLETMCEQQGIDFQEIDPELDYWENKAEIEARFGTVLVLDLSKLEEKKLEVKWGNWKRWEVLEFMEAIGLND